MARKKTHQKIGKISKVRKGDDVIVLAGRDKGKKGNILRVFPKESRIIVQGDGRLRRRYSEHSPEGQTGSDPQ